MNRRKFLSLAGGITGYSVMVKVDDLAASPAPLSRQEISKNFDVIAPPDGNLPKFGSEPHMTWVKLNCDVFVAGGGMAGVCAAIAAARNGAKVVLAQDRSRLGGNASSEVKMHIVGASMSGGRAGWREGGLIEELRVEDAVNNPQRSWEMWDLLLYDKVKSEPNITLLLDSALYSARASNGLIEEVFVRSDKTEHIYSIKAKVYCDCTGDSRLALESGAEFRWGRETREEFNEPLGLEKPDRETLGSSILFTARDYGKPMPFKAPKWARKVTKDQLRFRPIRSWEYGYWWIEWGGQLDTIRDNERIRFELLSIVTGVWDYIKNSGEHPTSANWAMDWCGMVPGKRESRRVIGDYILTQSDLLGLNGDLEDAVAIGGWSMDDHPPSGFDKSDQKPCVQIKMPEVYNIPLRSLYSKNIRNLMLAGRNISASHVAFTSTRVMATCAVMGQATGTAAALCTQHNMLPRQLYENKSRLNELQQVLLRDDQSIKNRKNTHAKDLALTAKVKASAEDNGTSAEKIINGITRNTPGKMDHCWSAKMTADGVWLELTWDKPQKISHLQFTFDTGFQRELTLTSQNGSNAKMIKAPQPETVKDYRVTYIPSGKNELVELLKVEGNYQRLNRHTFGAIETKTLRLHINATNGSENANVFEVRCYS